MTTPLPASPTPPAFPPLYSPFPYDITTINYTLAWPHLENPSNTTFAGTTPIDICKCKSVFKQHGSELDHIYTRYRCPRPEVHFSPATDDLWVLQVPLGQINMLRPATENEIQRRRELDRLSSSPDAFAGRNILLLTGPCPRGRYQAYATLQYLKSLAPEARQSIEYISLVIQPYEEDCSDDQGGRAYVELARYIMDELVSFKSLCLNIWGEETKLLTREFAMVLWREGVTIVVSWDWAGGEAEEYVDVEGFLRGVEEGVVKTRVAWGEAGDGSSSSSDGSDGGATVVFPEEKQVVEVDDEDAWTDEDEDEDSDNSSDAAYVDAHSGVQDTLSDEGDEFTEVEYPSDDEWSDAILTPLSPPGEVKSGTQHT